MSASLSDKEVLGIVEFFHIGEIVFVLATCISGRCYFVNRVTPVGIATFEKLGQKHGAFVSHMNFPDKASFETFAASHDFFKAYRIDWENLV